MSEQVAFIINLSPSGQLRSVEAVERSFKPVELRSAWCECAKDEFHSYPGDGECPCGMFKHHVHCTCGGVSQVG